MSTTEAQALLERIGRVRLNTEIRAIAKEVGKRPELAAHLWKQGGFSARMLSLLILDLKAVDVPRIERMIADLEGVADAKEQSQLLDWLIANVIMKKAALKNAAAEWRDDPSTLRQRVFWSVQARSVRAENRELNERLLEHIERELPAAGEKVQWNMNWCAAQIGIADERLRSRCIALGERLGLYRDYPVSKGCTSPYLPDWIGSVVGKKAPA
ncbi:MAG TPA: DNA alkylation repair protein [Longimicrobium sp.]|nr:DNA alkylation repair protein [Longimicrobium sp.]